MRTYLAFGGGVNSTALMILLKREGVDFEAVFSDTGVEFPHTYQYLDYLEGRGFKITRLTPSVSGCRTLEEYCLKYRIVPSVWRKWCVGKFKIRPLVKYYDKPCVEFIAFGSDERRRTLKRWTETKHLKGRIDVQFPLIERGLARADCVDIIRQEGLEVPKKSGCWMCPMMSREKVKKLYLGHRDLYERRKLIEENVPREYYFDPKGMPMGEIVKSLEV